MLQMKRDVILYTKATNFLRIYIEVSILRTPLMIEKSLQDFRVATLAFTIYPDQDDKV